MRAIAPARPGTLAGPKKNGMIQLRSTKAHPFPSAPQGRRSVMSGGGPAMAGNRVKKTTGRVGGGNRGPGGAWKILRGPGMARRAGVPKTALRGTRVVKRTMQARGRLRTKGGRQVIDTKGPGKIIKTKGKTVIRGFHGRTIVVTKKGSKVVNKKAGTVVRSKILAPHKVKVVKRWGVGTKTKADDARAVKFRGPNRGRLTYTGPGGRTTTVSRRKNAPRKVFVRVKGPGGKVKMTRVVGPKFTKTTRGGKTVTRKTRHLTEGQEKKTGTVGEKNWVRAGTGRRSKHMEDMPHIRKGKHKSDRQMTDWHEVKRFRAKRRRSGPRNRQSLTKTQLKNVASRRY